MARITPEEAAGKWQRRLSGAGEDIRRGIQNVSVAPGVKAAQQQPKMRAKTLAAIDDGSWARNTAAIGLEQWKNAALTKGVDRIASGAAGAEPKMASFMRQLLPAVDSAVSKVSAMPSNTLDENINRMTTYIREMAKFRKRPGE